MEDTQNYLVSKDTLQTSQKLISDPLSASVTSVFNRSAGTSKVFHGQFNLFRVVNVRRALDT